MRTSVSTATCEASEVVAVGGVRSAVAGRLADYLTLTKPRIAVLALVTVSAGYALGAADHWQALPLAHALLGIALVAAGSSALNQFLERATDGLMERTALRPLPDGRLSPAEVLAFGTLTSLAGIMYLAAFVNGRTAALAALTLVLYAGVYTPLKKVTSLSTAVGAIPGALPPILGWSAAEGPMDAAAFSLFAILFLWQFPHFTAIAWLYRDEYARAGLRMLPTGGRTPRVAGLLAVGYALALVPLGLYPAACGLAGSLYMAVAAALGAMYLVAAIRFAVAETARTARNLLLASLVYLPAILVVLVWDHFRLLS